ncbi:MAG TPA: PAS domain S-box protein [Terriglobales bacterium]
MDEAGHAFDTEAGERTDIGLRHLQANALAAIGNAVVLTDLSGNILWANPAFEQLTGYAVTEVAGKSTRLLKSGLTPVGLYQDLWQTILSGHKWSGEIINRRKDGSFYHEEMTIAPVMDGAGSLTNFVAVKKDITERKRLAERMQMLARAVENSSNLIAMTGPEGKLVYTNQALLDALQRSRESLLGRHFRELVSKNNSPEVLRELENPRDWRGECLSPRADGSDVRVLLNLGVIRGEGEQIVGLIGIAQDITDQKRLSERMQMLANAVEHSPDLVGMAGPDGRVVYANKALLETLRLSTDELLGAHFRKILSKNNPPHLLRQILTGSSQAGGWQGECLVPRTDGTDIPVLLSSNAVIAEDGRALGVLGVAQDITERKRAEKELFFKNALLQAEAETTIDGILAVDQSNRIILSNRRFGEIWNIPEALIAAGDDAPLLDYVTHQIEDVPGFLRLVEYLYEHRHEKRKDEIRLQDGRTLDRYTSPLLDPKGTYLGRIWYFRDISERIRGEERLKLWSQVLDQSAEGIFICDAQQNIVVVNSAFEQITGYSAQEAITKTPRILRSGRHDANFYLEMWRTLLSTGVWRGEIWNRRKNGELFAEWLSISVVYNRSGVPAHFVGIFSDVTERKRDQEKMLRLAQYDLLTDLPNRALLMEQLNQTIQVAERRKSKVGVMFLDLDRFKEVNDSLGHHAGDVLLQRVAERLSGGVRRGHDTVARMGGDEFVVIFPDLGNPRNLATIAHKLLSCFLSPVTIQEHELTVTASIGISLYPDDGLDAQELIRNADAAMYQAKAAGRNGYKFYTSDLNQRALEALSTENALRHAIERKEFALHYQPQVSLQTGQLIGVEALLRWNRHDTGMVMPSNFIGIAEERGLIVPIGRWVVEEACRQAAAWRRANAFSVPISVNVSAVQFRHRDFVDRLLSTIREYGISPGCLELELTERSVVHDPEGTGEKLRKLHGMGFRLAIDDFGTGYSSLSYLRRYPFDKIKIDRSFVMDENAANIVTAIIGLARSLNLKAIAEGVERYEQMEALRAQGCDEAQGFLFGPAVPAAEFEVSLREWQLDFDPANPFRKPLTRPSPQAGTLAAHA